MSQPAPECPTDKRVPLLAGLLKIVLFSLPYVVAPLFGFRELGTHPAQLGAVLLCGVCLQALVPPRRKHLASLIGIALALTALYAVAIRM